MIQEILSKFQRLIGTWYKVEYITTDGNITYVFVYMLLGNKQYLMSVMFSIVHDDNNKFHLYNSYQIDGRLNAKMISAMEKAIEDYNK